MSKGVRCIKMERTLQAKGKADRKTEAGGVWPSVVCVVDSGSEGKEGRK